MFQYNFSVKDLEYYLLLLTRIASFMFSAPFFSMNNVPRRVKAGLSVFLAFLVYITVVPHPVLEYTTVVGYAILVIKETFCGLSIGFCANLALYVLQFAGSNIDRDIGLAMVSIFDPMTRQQTGFTGSLYQYAFMLILMLTNLHHYVLRAFFESFTLIPTGRVVIPADGLVYTVTGYIMDSFIIAFRIYLPIYATMLLLNSILGILAKVAPQMNMFSVGVQLKIFVGFAALIATASLIPIMGDFISGEMKRMITNVIEVLSSG